MTKLNSTYHGDRNILKRRVVWLRIEMDGLMWRGGSLLDNMGIGIKVTTFRYRSDYVYEVLRYEVRIESELPRLLL